MGNYNSWKSEDRYYDICPMCGQKLPQRHMVLLKKQIHTLIKNLQDYVKIVI